MMSPRPSRVLLSRQVSKKVCLREAKDYLRVQTEYPTLTRPYCFAKTHAAIGTIATIGPGLGRGKSCGLGTSWQTFGPRPGWIVVSECHWAYLSLRDDHWLRGGAEQSASSIYSADVLETPAAYEQYQLAPNILGTHCQLVKPVCVEIDIIVNNGIKISIDLVHETQGFSPGPP